MSLSSVRPLLRVGRYGVFREIAAGGMATVHLGRQLGDAGFGRIVAIKRMHPHLSKQREFVDMFLDEARLVARIRHPNIVPTLDVVVEGSEVLLVMEYVEGESLARLAAQGRKQGEIPSIALLAGVMVGVLRGLHAAHESRDEAGTALGLVHRDVSPQNILVGTDGVGRVLDFGIAKARGRTQETHEGQLKGKPAYMAPEQLLGEPVDRRTDVFAASIVFWELLTGKRLFRGENEVEAMRLVLERFIDPPSRVGADSAVLDEIVLRGLDRDPAARFQSAREMATAIEEATRCSSASEIEQWVRGLAGEALSARAEDLLAVEAFSDEASNASSPALDTPPTPAAAPLAPTLTDGLSSPTTVQLERASGSTRARTIGVVIALVLALGGLSAVALSGRRGAVSPDPPAPPSSGPATTAAREASGVRDQASAESPPPAPMPSANANASTSGPGATGGARPPSVPAGNGCRPPYTVDARGIKHPKPACYR